MTPLIGSSDDCSARSSGRTSTPSTASRPGPLRAGTRLRRRAIQATILVALSSLRLLAFKRPLRASARPRGPAVATAPAVRDLRPPEALGPGDRVPPGQEARPRPRPRWATTPGRDRTQGVWEKKITLDIARELQALLQSARVRGRDDAGAPTPSSRSGSGPRSPTSSGPTCSSRSTSTRSPSQLPAGDVLSRSD